MSQQYWNDRWKKEETRWDIGYPSPAITNFMDSLSDKNLAILIPGCGNAYEAEYLVGQGFTNITLIDIAPKAVEKLRQKFIDHPAVRILCEDFFHHQGTYDVIIEQTFFCAIPPSRRIDYAQKMKQLLSANGILIGLLFNREFGNPTPPFGGDAAAYKEIFSPYLDIHKMEPCYNSIPPREGTELFIQLTRKKNTKCGKSID